MAGQNAFGSKQVHRDPDFSGVTKIARVTSAVDFNQFGRIEVIFLDYGQPMPVWVVGDIEREPVAGDQVIIGYIDGRKDSPYLIGFVKNKSYTTNFVVVKKDKIKFQLPIFDIGVIDGKAHKDTEGNLLDNSKQAERAYIELTPTYALLSFPTSPTGATEPAIIKVTATGIDITHVGAVHMDGSSFKFGKDTPGRGDDTKPVARVGDTVSVTTPDGTFTGTITSGSDNFRAK
jgi:uncharacterized Zn-binding protein involved in type VI secretion